jgi:nitroreductase
MNIRKIIRTILGARIYLTLIQVKKKTSLFLSMLRNYGIDFLLFYKHSTLFKQNSYEKIESLLILKYHSIEKGFLHDPIRFSFGKQNVIEIIKLLRREDIISNCRKTQIAASYLSICTYYEFHAENNVDISSFFSKKDYDFFKSISVLKYTCVETKNENEYFKDSKADFLTFSNSRSSVRDFSGKLIPLETIEKVIELAKNAPSVCNRQPVKVYYIDDKSKIDSIFDIQKGLKGYTDNISQLLIVVSDRSYFYSVGERNQLYIDGGLFLMNLLYALHFYKISSCPANWGLSFDADRKVMKILNMRESEKVICLVPIGLPQSEFKTTLSLRRSINEILIKIPKESLN